MAADITITPITAGMTDEWRDFVADLKGSRRIEWAQSQRRRGITREVVSIASGSPDLAAIYTESSDHAAAAQLLNNSMDPFDEWYREQLSRLLATPLDVAVVFDSAPQPGLWKGWR